MSKSFTGHYRLPGQAKCDLMAFWKKLKKLEKYRRNSLIENILSDSISVGPIYLSHLKNQKSKRCQETTFWKDTWKNSFKKIRRKWKNA